MSTSFTSNADYYGKGYEDWLDRNELYRTEATSPAVGGQPLADMVDSINASLYTFKLNVDAAPYYRPATLDSVTDRFMVDGPSFDTVDLVRIRHTQGTINDLGLSHTQDYYVVNVEGNSFQLAADSGRHADRFFPGLGRRSLHRRRRSRLGRTSGMIRM